MILADVNVLVYAHRRDASTDHEAYAEFVTAMAPVRGPSAFPKRC